MKIFKHYDKGVWILLATIYKAIYGIFFTVWLMTQLPAKEWAAFILVQTTFILISQFSLAFGMSPYIKFYSGKAAHIGLQSNSLLMTIGFALPILIILTLARPQFAHWFEIESLSTLIFFIPLTFLTSLPKVIINEIFKAKQKLKYFFFSEAAYFSGNMILVGILASVQPLENAIQILIPINISYLLTSVYAVWLAKSDILWEFKIDTFLLRKMMDFGKYSLGNFASNALFSQADLYIIGLTLNPYSVAVFSAVKLWAHGFQMYRQAVNTIIFPAFSRLHNSGRWKELRPLFEKGVFYSLILLILMSGFLIAAADFLFTVILQKYQQGGEYLRWYALIGLFVAWQYMGEALLSGIGKPGKIFVTRLITGVISLVVMASLVKLYGIAGAIAAALFSHALIAIFIAKLVHSEIQFTFAKTLWRRHDFFELLWYLKYSLVNRKIRKTE
ncbi:MAG: hypothetical protein DWQ05_21960 [Calditrichaeota bacterium]|nr:MAG: hypothetical protein DWQ05_21960 [Calditrichota bacterium]